MIKYDPHIHQRCSVRLKGYDYSQGGYYFVTICTQNRRPLFGEIKNDVMILNDAGKMVDRQWNGLAGRFKNIQLDEYIVMPNHFHGIIIIVANIRAGTRPAPTPLPTFGDMVGAFKSITSHEYINGVKQNHWKPFDGKLWQRNYYEQIIRNETSLQRIREYIINNPRQWQHDKLFAP